MNESEREKAYRRAFPLVCRKCGFRYNENYLPQKCLGCGRNLARKRRKAK